MNTLNLGHEIVAHAGQAVVEQDAHSRANEAVLAFGMHGESMIAMGLIPVVALLGYGAMCGAEKAIMQFAIELWIGTTKRVNKLSA